MNLTDLLNQKQIKFKNTNNPAEILITCTSGLHVDKSPSLTYNIEKDIFNCWSCGFKGRKRRFLRSIGVTVDVPFDSKQPYRIEILKQKLESIYNHNTIEMPKNTKIVNSAFRNISKEVIEYFEAFTTSEYSLEDYICFPVYQFGKLKFIESRNRFPKAEKPKYMRFPANSKVANVLFPIDKVNDKSRLIIVEGLFDMLNMWNSGYNNCVCNFGINFNKQKLDLLDKLGTTYVEILLDGDEPGRRGALAMSNLLESRYIKNKIIYLNEGTDPGSLTSQQLNVILPKDRFDE